MIFEYLSLQEPIAIEKTKRKIKLIQRQTSPKVPPVLDISIDAIALMEQRQFFSVHEINVTRQNSTVMIQIRPYDIEMDLLLFFAKKYPGPMTTQHEDVIIVGQTKQTKKPRELFVCFSSGNIAFACIVFNPA